MIRIVDTLTSKQIHSLFLMHYGTSVYNEQDFCYGYQFAGACIHANNSNKNIIGHGYIFPNE